MPPSSVHFNGSVNLPDAETVMREISSRIPEGVRRMTDGETADRNYWIVFQTQKFGAMPDFQTAGMRELPPGVDAPPMPLLRLADGVAAEDVHWPDLGYAAAYADSYQTFRRLQDAGTIPIRGWLPDPVPHSGSADRVEVRPRSPGRSAGFLSGCYVRRPRSRARCGCRTNRWPSEVGCRHRIRDARRRLRLPQSPGGSDRAGTARTAPIRYPATCRSACTCAMATPDTSISKTHSHWPCRSRWPTQSPRRPAGRLTGSRSPCPRHSATATTSRRSPTSAPGQKPSCTSRSCPTTQPARPRHHRPAGRPH